MPKVFKVWTHDYQSRKAVCVSNTVDVLQNVIIKANETLKISGKSIVLAKDGTEMDEDDGIVSK